MFAVARAGWYCGDGPEQVLIHHIAENKPPGNESKEYGSAGYCGNMQLIRYAKNLPSGEHVSAYKL